MKNLVHGAEKKTQNRGGRKKESDAPSLLLRGEERGVGRRVNLTEKKDTREKTVKSSL